MRRALRSNTPIVQNQAAAALVVLGHRWCVEEITRALADASASDGISALRAALTLLSRVTNTADDTDDTDEADASLRPSIDSLRPHLGPLRAALEHLPS